MTLHRLATGDSLDDALDWLDEDTLNDLDWSLHEVIVGDPAGIVIHAQGPDLTADWCNDLRTTTGIAVAYGTRTAGALLILLVDDNVYAAGYGNGYLWLKDDAKDPRFGLNFAARCVDADRIQDLVRRTAGARGYRQHPCTRRLLNLEFGRRTAC